MFTASIRLPILVANIAVAIQNIPHKSVYRLESW